MVDKKFFWHTIEQCMRVWLNYGNNHLHLRALASKAQGIIS